MNKKNNSLQRITSGIDFYFQVAVFVAMGFVLLSTKYLISLMTDSYQTLMYFSFYSFILMLLFQTLKRSSYKSFWLFLSILTDFSFFFLNASTFSLAVLIVVKVEDVISFKMQMYSLDIFVAVLVVLYLVNLLRFSMSSLNMNAVMRNIFNNKEDVKNEE